MAASQQKRPTPRKSSPGAGTARKKTSAPGSAQRANTRKKSGSKSHSKAKPEPRFGDSFVDGVLLVLVMALCVFLFISLVSGATGAVGQSIAGVLRGLLGLGAYLLPLLVLVFCVWLLLRPQRFLMGFKVAGGVILLLALSALVHSITAVSYNVSPTLLYQNGGAGNGGIIGGAISQGLVGSIGKIGAYLVLIVLLCVSYIFMTGFSMFRYAGNRHQRQTERREQRAERIRQEQEAAAQWEEERRQREVERWQREHKQQLKKENRRDMFNVKVRTGEEAPGVKAPKTDPLPENTAELSPKPGFLSRFSGGTASEPVVPEGAVAAESGESAPVPLAESAPEAEAAEEPILIQVSESGTAQPEEEPPVIMLRSAYQAPEAGEALESADQWPEAGEGDPEIPGLELSPELDFGLLEEANPAGVVLNGDLSAVPAESLAPQPMQTAELRSTTQKEPTSAAVVPSALGAAGQAIPKKYVFPPFDLLGKGHSSEDPGAKTEMLSNAKKLEETLRSFGVEARVSQINKGPTVTRYEIVPKQGVKVSKIVNLADDIALNLAASGIRIEAPIPGKAAVGIEVPNREAQSVFLRDVLESDAFQKFPSKLAFALGEDIAGSPVVTDIAKMPHLLIAGATGSGKSVCINTLITSILYKATPEEVRLLMIDPKVVELSVYNGIPHLLLPVVTDPKKAAGTLNWAVREMLRRYNEFFECNVRDISGYNAHKRETGEEGLMPQIVIIIDELADLMMAAPKEVEDAICRLAQMARAAGMHLIIATQRPSVDVITGLIKANIPSRLAFAVSSGIDSRTILDMVGAEKLLGKGDMLFYPVGTSKPVRIQGAFVTDKEVERLVEFVKGGQEAQYDPEVVEQMTSATKPGTVGDGGSSEDGEGDELFLQALELVVTKEKASVSMLQRQFRIGFNRAARLMDELEAAGAVGPEEGSKPRKVKMSLAEFEAYKNGHSG